ncbi:MAG: hypothetical protein CSB49_01915 [Proteobacteria bacterium]|nr:MAG: hypothetical protein CSB49_01915 [Pseudomonadota bacterium]
MGTIAGNRTTPSSWRSQRPTREIETSEIAIKRFSRRVPYGAWVEAIDEGAPSFYLAHSLSPQGLRLLAANDHTPPVGPVQLRLVVENETRVVSVQGEVVSDEPAGARHPRAFAIRFTELDEERRLFLTDLYDEACGF